MAHRAAMSAANVVVSTPKKPRIAMINAMLSSTRTVFAAYVTSVGPT
jgi:hypothetical protein